MSAPAVDELETAFQNCFASLTSQEHLNINDNDEVRASVEQSIQNFLDAAKQLECFFLQKRSLLSIHKPEQIIKEDIVELRQEIMLKDALIERHHEKLVHWQSILTQRGGVSQASQLPPTSSAQVSSGGQPVSQPSQQQPTQQPPQQQTPMQMQAQHTSPHHPHHNPQSQMQGPPFPQQHMGNMPPHTMHHPGSFPQGPLAFLEQTTSNIGMPERR